MYRFKKLGFITFRLSFVYVSACLCVRRFRNVAKTTTYLSVNVYTYLSVSLLISFFQSIMLFIREIFHLFPSQRVRFFLCPSIDTALLCNYSSSTVFSSRLCHHYKKHPPHPYTCIHFPPPRIPSFHFYFTISFFIHLNHHVAVHLMNL